MYHFNVLVVGAGAVGLACANELQKKIKNVLVLEKNNFIGSETSARNSEVIHSGIYYEPNSLKAAFCEQVNSRRATALIQSRGFAVCMESNYRYSLAARRLANKKF